MHTVSVCFHQFITIPYNFWKCKGLRQELHDVAPLEFYHRTFTEINLIPYP